jgi:(p)ppGpp synthase/HD superfamily hydrolase
MTPAFSDALIYAATRHSEIGQTRLFTGEPYIVHPIDVAMLLPRFGIADEAAGIAALLHDTVEDTDATIEDVTERFGEEVGRIVASLTNRPGETAAEKAIRLASADWKAQAVKCADIISNCMTLPTLSLGFARTYLPKKAAEVAILSRAPVALWRQADLVTRLDRLVIA